MTTSKTFVVRVLSSGLAVLLLVPVLVAAQGTPTPTAAPTAAAVVKVDAKLQAAKDKAYKEIDRRIQALNDLSARINAMQRVTANFKQALATDVQNQVTGLTQLKVKIEADADVETLKADVKTITDSYRVFMLVMPRARIATAADREVTLITMMNQLGAKLQARISAAQSAGSDVTTLMTALTDMSTKLKDANSKAQAAVSVSATLTPDEGDKTKAAQNAAALKAARTDIQAAHKDLIAARKDAETIIKGLRALPPATSGVPTSSPQQ